jgi:hypothetical protein
MHRQESGLTPVWRKDSAYDLIERRGLGSFNSWGASQHKKFLKLKVEERSMSRKPLLAIILLLISILVYGAIGSGVWLSDQEIQVGEAAAPENEEIFINTSGIVPVILNDVKPGIWYGPYKVDLYNPDGFGTLPVKYRIYDRLRAESIPGMFEHTNIKVSNFRCSGELYNYWEGNLQDLYWESQLMSTHSGVLDVKYTHCFEFNFELEQATDHVFTGESLSFDIIFDAAQVNDPSW